MSLMRLYARYESIHKAVQYENSGAIQIAIMNESDGITMGLTMFEDSRASEGDVRQTSLSNAEETEAAARNYCEGFTAHFRVWDLTEDNVSSKFQKRVAVEMRQVRAPPAASRRRGPSLREAEEDWGR
jgi:hypothetical protein